MFLGDVIPFTGIATVLRMVGLIPAVVVESRFFQGGEVRLGRAEEIEQAHILKYRNGA